MAAVRVDLNADLGEGAGTDEELLEIITSVSVACGGHAGDEATMRWVTERAAARGVAVGAHPSYPDREGFGRRPIEMPGSVLAEALADQIDALRAVSPTPIRFVKAHGTLYNQAAADASIAAVLVSVVRDRRIGLLCPAGSETWRLATEQGVRCFAEAFADRAYAPDGRLAGRGTPGAVIDDPDTAARRAVRLAVDGVVEASDGSTVPVTADSICIHGDTPGAVAVARAVRTALAGAGVAVQPFVAGS